MFAIMGAIAGLLGSLFIYLNIRATALRAQYIPPRKPKLRLLEVKMEAGIAVQTHWQADMPCLNVCSDVLLPSP